MSMYIFDMLDEVVYEDFELKLNFVGDKSFEIIMDYELHDNGGYNILTKFFVCMEQIWGGYCIDSITFDRRNKKVTIVGDDYYDKKSIEQKFNKIYDNMKECFYVDRFELEDIIDTIIYE